MPTVANILLKCVFYIYLSKDDAKNSYPDSATGFFFGVPSETHNHITHLYAVTNRHVIEQAATPSLRINSQEGRFEIIETKPEEWRFHPFNADLAIRHIELDRTIYDYHFFHSDYLITKEFIKQYEIGAGDDIFMIGNFQTRGGKKRNIPSVRFGNISQMPHEAMENPHTKDDEESFIVEMRSTSGYSGSPVLLTNIDKKWTFSDDQAHGSIPRMVTLQVHDFFKLLGIDWGHIVTREYLYDSNRNKLPGSESVLINSAMAGVVPSWKLAEMIFSEEEIERRK